MSKFDRYKKQQGEQYIYPHKHCSKCGEMIEEALTYCAKCYEQLKQKKKKRRFGRKSKPQESSEIPKEDEKL